MISSRLPLLKALRRRDTGQGRREGMKGCSRLDWYPLVQGHRVGKRKNKVQNVTREASEGKIDLGLEAKQREREEESATSAGGRDTRETGLASAGTSEWMCGYAIWVAESVGLLREWVRVGGRYS